MQGTAGPQKGAAGERCSTDVPHLTNGFTCCSRSGIDISFILILYFHYIRLVLNTSREGNFAAASARSWRKSGEAKFTSIAWERGNTGTRRNGTTGFLYGIDRPG